MAHSLPTSCHVAPIVLIRTKASTPKAARGQHGEIMPKWRNGTQWPRHADNATSGNRV
ncbi:MAG: hypothetical protein PUJ04_09055 [Bacteroidales bacterium]|nr:hypothetical protein [Bacteroidales bacterium]